MRVLIAVPFYTPNIFGGAEISSQIIAEGFAKLGHEVTVMTLGEINETIQNAGVEIVRIYDRISVSGWQRRLSKEKIGLPLKVALNWRALVVNKRMLTRYLDYFAVKQFDVAIINSNEDYMLRATLWEALKLSHIPTILTLRDYVLLERRLGPLLPLYNKIVQKQAGWFRYYAAPSQYTAKFHENAGYVMPQKRIIYNTVDMPCQNVGLKIRRVLYVGAISPYKGVLTLLRASDILHQRHGREAFELILIGRSDLPPEEIENHDGVHVLSWMPREQVYQYMRESMAVVLPSEWPEPFGRVLIEAIYNGTLAVGSSAGAIPELFDNDERYVFKEKSAEDLARKIERIFCLNDEDYKRETEALQRKWEKFSVKQYVSEWEAYCIATQTNS